MSCLDFLFQSKNGQQLILALNFFVSSVNTLCNKTMEDTIFTVRQYETARSEKLNFFAQKLRRLLLVYPKLSRRWQHSG
jgi:Arfaptin-like domain